MFLDRGSVIRSIVVALGAELGLMAGGWLLALSEAGRPFEDSFFGYRLYYAAGLPVAFVAGLALLVLNGVCLFEWATISGSLNTPSGSGWGRYVLHVPLPELKTVAVNLIAIPTMLVLFVIARDGAW